MCRKATCDTCKKTSWVGCGMHVQSVMDAVPANEHCTCEPKFEKDGNSYPPKASSAPA